MIKKQQKITNIIDMKEKFMETIFLKQEAIFVGLYIINEDYLKNLTKITTK